MVSSAVKKRPRLDSLTGLRWWAAFGVFAYHMANLAPLRHQNFFNVGYTGFIFLCALRIRFNLVTNTRHWCETVLVASLCPDMAGSHLCFIAMRRHLLFLSPRSQ